MTPLRLVALVPLLAITSCYSDAATQSTVPEPRYVAGPPGGLGASGNAAEAYEPSAPGPGYAAAQPAPANPAPPSEALPDDDDDDDDATDPGAAPVIGEQDVASSPVDPADPVDPGGPTGASGAAGVAVDPQAPDGGALTDPTARVSDTEIDVTLNAHGQWIDTDDYGQVWRPDATAVGVDFTPYESGGSWEYTDAGWAFASDYTWGWLPFHYGRWAWFHDYWGWVPGHRWGPAWVDWRHGGGIVGWRPRPPRARDHRNGGPNMRDHRHGSGTVVRDHRSAQVHDAHWRFATTSDFGRPHVRSHLYGNLAEGLRVTSKVTAPPLRARTTIHAPDLMRNRFTAGGRDHRSVDPGRPYPGPQGVRSYQGPQGYPPAGAQRDATRGYQQQPPGNQQPGGYQPPRGYQQPGGYQQPPRGYQQLPRGYQQPPRGYQQPPRGYQQPPRGGASPVRGYSPPRSYRPPSSAPSRSSSAPSHTGSFGGSHSSGSSSTGSHSSGSSSSGSHSSSSNSSSGRHR